MSDELIYRPFSLLTVIEAIKLAELRILESKVLRLNAATTYESNDAEILQRNVNSILAELVIGRQFNKLYLPSTNTFHNQADVGEDIEVRSSTNPDSALIFRDNDDVTRRYVLVICDAMKGFSVRGWAYGYEIRKDEWYYQPKNANERPAWFYRGTLRPWNTLTQYPEKVIEVNHAHDRLQYNEKEYVW